MLLLDETPHGFNLFFNGQPVIEHTGRRPFLETGTGNGTYREGGGIYKIRDHRLRMTRLRQYRAVTDTPSLVILEADGGPRIHFECEDGLLVIRFSGLPEGTNRLVLRLARGADPHVYGCGEQYTHLDLSGRKVPLWIGEQGIGRGHDLLTLLANLTHKGAGGSWHNTYYSQPTFVTGSNRFVHADSTSYAVFDFTRRRESTLTFWQVPSKITLGVEADIRAVMRKLTELTGRQPPLPDWAYDGVWLGVQGGNDAVRSKYADAKAAGVPVAALWAQDWEGRRVTAFGSQLWWNWQYDPALYPDLPSEIASYRSEGVRYLGYINPFLAPERELYAEASARGFLVKAADGGEYRVQVTTFPAALVDLTNPEAFEWIKGIIKKNLIGIGLSGWMADFGEWMPLDSKPFSSENPELVHNKYAMLWAKANFEAAAEAAGAVTAESGKPDEIAFFCRSGYTGSAKYATAFWAGDQMVDCDKTDGLPTVVVSGLSLGLNGIGISHSDIGGYTSVGWIKRDRETFMRWTEQAVFTPIMRTHESNRPLSNCQFNTDPEVLAHFARMVRFHVALKPYIKALAEEYLATGMPPMRALWMHYPKDKTAYTLQDQYLFGEDLLVAPVLSTGRKSRRLYVPSEGWVGLFDGKPVRAGWIRVSAPVGRPPAFYRVASPRAELFAGIAHSTISGD